VSALNEFVYCPRRYYYQRYYDEIGEPYELVDGRLERLFARGREIAWVGVAVGWVDSAVASRPVDLAAAVSLLGATHQDHAPRVDP